MKWIKSRVNFLKEEAKIKDVILPKQAEQVKSQWGENFLELEEIEPTENIIQGRWKLSQEDKLDVLSVFFQSDLKEVYNFLGSLPNEFNDILKKSINLELLKGGLEISQSRWTKILDNFDIKKPSINQICSLTDPIFRKISMGESTSPEVITRDANGRPIKDEDGKIIKRKREDGEIIFSNNLVNIITFISDFNQLHPNLKVDESKFITGNIQKLISSAKEDFNEDYRVEVDVFSRDMFLSIKHNPKDILNISISKFYTSCQHLYTGGYRYKLFGNVVDPNTIPAFIIFDTPIFDEDEDLISEQLPLCRMMIRNIEGYNTSENELFFDRAYPDRMQDKLTEIIEKYSGNKKMENNKYFRMRYTFTPDIPSELSVSDPYMDRLDLKRSNIIGVNTKNLHLTRYTDWSEIKISPNAKIKELTIETTDVPENLFQISQNLDWIKIKSIKINDLSVFNKMKCDSWAFEKCKLDGTILNQVKSNNPNIKRLQIIGCDINNLDLSNFKGLDELSILYSIDPDELIDKIKDIDAKKIIISSDLVQNENNKKFINSLKSRGVKIQISGPNI